MPGEIANVAIRFSLINEASKAIAAIGRQLKALSVQDKKTMNDHANMMRSFKVAAVAGLGTAVLYKGTKVAVRGAGDLQEAFIGVRAELMEVDKSAAQINSTMKSLKATAFDVQGKTPFDMAQMMRLEKELVKAGATVEDIAGKTGFAAAAAFLGVYENIDPLRAGEAMISMAVPFKIAGKDAMNLADDISRSAAASVISADDILETAKMATSALGPLGRGHKEFLTMAAMLGQVGIKGSLAGTSMSRFYTNASKQKGLRDANGDLLEMDQLISRLRERFGTTSAEEMKVFKEAGDDMDLLMTKLKKMGKAERLVQLTDMFDVRGARVAVALLNDGVGSYEDMVEAQARSASLQDKLAEKMKGFNASMTALKGDFSSTINNLFQPALTPLTALIKKVDEFVYKIGEASLKGDSLGKTVSAMSLGGIAAGGAITAGAGVAGLYYMRRLVKGAGGWKGLMGKGAGVAGGVAAGKAVEAATGVKPVFVTNWPAQMSGSSLYPNATSTMAAAGLGGRFGKLKGLAGMAGRGALRLGPHGLALAAGWGIGRGISNIPTGGGKNVQDRLEGLIDRVLNSEGLRKANEAEASYKKWQEQRNMVNLTVNVDRDGNVTVETDDLNTELPVGSLI